MTEDELDECLRALSHKERRRLYRACREQAQAAGDLAELSALALASVSEHLKVMRKSGLLEVTKDGRFWLYRAAPSRLHAVIEAMDKLENPDGT